MITLHVGLHKTGSTSIQAALSLISHRRGLDVLLPGRNAPPSFDFLLSTLREAQPSNDLIVSDENLLGKMSDCYAERNMRLMSLREALRGVNFRIIVYVRPQLTWLSSVYLQLVQQGESTAPDAFWANMRTNRGLSWFGLAKALWQESGAESVQVRLHDNSRDVVNDFFDICELGKAPIAVPDDLRLNRSITPLQAPILAAMNSGDGPRGQNSVAFRRILQGSLMSTDQGKWSPFAPEIQDEITRIFQPDWDRLVELVESSDAAEGERFRRATDSDNSGPIPYPGDSITDEAVAQESVRLLREACLLIENRQEMGLLAKAWRAVLSRPKDIPRILANKAFSGRSF